MVRCSAHTTASLVARALSVNVLEDAMLASEYATAPLFFEAAAQDPSPDVALRDLLEPFADRLRQPYVKFSKGAGEPADESGDAEEVLRTFFSRRPRPF